jgi:hypothetical protein
VRPADGRPGATDPRVLRLPAGRHSTGGSPARHLGARSPARCRCPGVLRRADLRTDRSALLAEQLAGSEHVATTDRDDEAGRLQSAINDAQQRRNRLLRSLELADDPDGELVNNVNVRLVELRAEIESLTTQLRDVQERPDPTPTPALLDLLPSVGPDLARVPEEHARRLFDAFRLET